MPHDLSTWTSHIRLTWTLEDKTKLYLHYGPRVGPIYSKLDLLAVTAASQFLSVWALADTSSSFSGAVSEVHVEMELFERILEDPE